jgi:hypothetical protein
MCSFHSFLFHFEFMLLVKTKRAPLILFHFVLNVYPFPVVAVEAK